MKNLVILVPFIVMLGGYIHHHHNRVMPIVLTVEDCVFNKWRSWESIRGQMPNQEEVNMFREECWTDMGATINEG